MAEMNGKALSAIAAGTLIMWSGIKGWSIFGTLGDLVMGRPPVQNVVNPLNPSAGTGTLGKAPSSDIVVQATQYLGHPYRFGGAPGPNAENPWDCSSFVNYIVAVRLGRPIPGYKAGQWDGTSHGPPTTTWGVWNGYTHVDRSAVMAGDILVWVGHMGIAVSPTQMISALNPDEGTKITPIEGYGNGPFMTAGRLNG